MQQPIPLTSRLDALAQAEPALLLALSGLAALCIALMLWRLWKSVRDSQRSLGKTPEPLLPHQQLHRLFEQKDSLEAEFVQLKAKWLGLKLGQQSRDLAGHRLPHAGLNYQRRASDSLAIVHYGIKSTQLIGLLREAGLLLIRLCDATRLPVQGELLDMLVQLNEMEKDILLHLGEIEHSLGNPQLPFLLDTPSDSLRQLPMVIERHADAIERHERLIHRLFAGLHLEVDGPRSSRRLSGRGTKRSS